jgi:wyosine [tRNA(Phe)-imidazoG37] synthetase (radical SAM superfamily)
MENKICSVPFFKIQVHLFRYVDFSKIVLVPCCGQWLKDFYKFSNIVIEEKNDRIDLMSAWNSPQMIEFRKSILDGSFRYCNKDTCPYFYSNKLYKASEQVMDSIHKKETILEYPPETIDLCLDLSCNLQCPSCRVQRYKVDDKRTYTRTIKFMEIAKTIFMNGSGETFTNNNILKALREYTSFKYPQLERFLFITNGTLLNKTMWLSLPIDLRERIADINVSVDSFNKESYEKIRVGSKFEVIQRNLLFLSSLRKSQELKHITITNILQKKNIHELYDFVSRAIDLGFDTIIINKIENWIYDEDFFNTLKMPLDWKIKYSKEIEKTLNLIKSSKIELISNVLKIC